MRLWDADTGRALRVDPALPIGIYSPRGDRLVTEQGQVWNMDALVLLGSLPLRWQSRLAGDAIDLAICLESRRFAHLRLR